MKNKESDQNQSRKIVEALGGKDNLFPRLERAYNKNFFETKRKSVLPPVARPYEIEADTVEVEVLDYSNMKKADSTNRPSRRERKEIKISYLELMSEGVSLQLMNRNDAKISIENGRMEGMLFTFNPNA